jgi:hypothetical protein
VVEWFSPLAGGVQSDPQALALLILPDEFVEIARSQCRL